jgi:hypothetical protein
MWGVGVGALSAPGGAANIVREQAIAVNAKSKAAPRVHDRFIGIGDVLVSVSLIKVPFLVSE